MKSNDIYAELKPIDGESKYVDYEDMLGQWAIFGSDSGFCYSVHESKERADSSLEFQIRSA